MALDSFLKEWLD